jgi:adenine-specific DNA-methyltransferase
MIKINNRRYIGNKYKLLREIDSCIDKKEFASSASFADLFAGTGVVSYYFASKGYDVIVNDILYSNFVAFNAWLSDGQYDIEKLKKTINYFNSLSYDDVSPNYFSDIYSEKYFSFNDAKKIGYIREYLNENDNKFTAREFYILLTSLLYSADKIANTVGHFEYFLKKTPEDTNFKLDLLDLTLNTNATIFNCDANLIAEQIHADIVYIDPPYNARQYVNFYHVLENLARWNKPTVFEGNSMKFKRNELKSGYSRSEAPKLFEDLICKLKCKLIIVSYNNTYEAKSIASINKITENQLIDILSRKGTLSKKEISYNAFNAGKTDLSGHKEYLYICKVNEE